MTERRSTTIDGHARAAGAAVDRRSRLFWECARRIAPEPPVQPEATGCLLGPGTGLGELVEVIAPLFRREQQLIRWVALRGAVTSLYSATIMHRTSTDALDALAGAMGLRLTVSPDGPGAADASVSPGASDGPDASGGRLCAVALAPGQLPGRRLGPALVLGNTVFGLLRDYKRFVDLPVPVEDTIAHPAFAALTDAGGLECIAWSAVALLRTGHAQRVLPKVPEPDPLTGPGWYPEPVFGYGERYWDGTDWTSLVRDDPGHETTLPLRAAA
jgi:hypothetical protein